MKLKLYALAAVLGLQAIASQADAACTAGHPNAFVSESTPTSAFTDHGDGTLTHQLTGLMWKRCVQGQGGADCSTGDALGMHWSAAAAAAVADTTAGYDDWRLPNKKELESIVEFCGFLPAVNQAVFPALPGHLHVGYWTSSTLASAPSEAWTVGFGDGHATAADKTGSDFAVRLVRGGPPADAFDATSRPPTLDVDGNGAAEPLADGVLIVRYLFGLRGTALIQGALGAGARRTSAAAIESRLRSSTLDVDGDGTADALTDGLLVIRYLFGMRGPELIRGALGAGAVRRTEAQIEAFLRALVPA